MIKATRALSQTQEKLMISCELDEKDIGCFFLEVQFTRDTALLIPKTSYIIIILLKDYRKATCHYRGVLTV